MNARSHVLGVVLLESTLRELGFAQVSSSDILLVSGALAFVLTVLLGALFSRMFTQPITAVQRFAGKLAGGEYEARMNSAQRDEIGELARSMDILARRLFEARSRDERLREQQSAFFATISHELKTPVTVIRGSLEALRDGVVSGGDDVRAYYNQMLTECKGLQRLIIDLLELSRLQNADFSLNMGSVDVRELLGDVAMSAGALCSRKGVPFAAPGNALQIVGDYARLRQMLLVVLDNAVKFTPEGKRVSLALEGKTIVIADEGIGIPAEELAILPTVSPSRRGNEQERAGSAVAAKLRGNGARHRRGQSRRGGNDFPVHIPRRRVMNV
ncbi:MAG: histidine kinase dimerization/phospho-acceptor domain-containing protein [Christensenellales bacterium]